MIKKNIIDYIKKNRSEWKRIRQYFHQHPELSMNEFNTSQKIKELLIKWNYEVIECSNTGIIGILRNGNGNRKIAIRAELDGLPIKEENQNLVYKSLNENMHACGHDGHLTMALAVCQYFAETKVFNGAFYVIFQPGEENSMGAMKMIEDGLLDKINPDRIYALHNVPYKQLKCGSAGDLHFYNKADPIMAANDMFEYKIIGKSTHGSSPQNGIDPIVAGSSIVMNLQSIVSRNLSPFDKSVVTVGAFNAGHAANAIPEYASIKVSIRSLDINTRDLVLKRVDDIVLKTCEMYNCLVQKNIEGTASFTINNLEVNEFARQTAIEVFGKNKVFSSPQLLASEDYGYFLDRIPGCLVFINNGDSADLHNNHYDFNDEIIPYGVAFLISLLEKELT